MSSTTTLLFSLFCTTISCAHSAKLGKQDISPTPINEETKPYLYQESTPTPHHSAREFSSFAATFDQNHFEYTNPEVTDDGIPLFESDMILTEMQRSSRQATSNLWPTSVDYAIESTSAADRSAIEAGINEWRTHTCIQFNEVSSGHSGAHLSFFKGGGCWSYVGKVTSSGPQQISIGSGCTGLGTVVHEIGHAMGLYHQQSRSDRDTYVIINLQNVQSGKEGNFNKHTSSSNHGVPYDLTSVMHYGTHYFSSNGLPTIQTRNVLHEGLIGNRGGFSHRDKQIANAMYTCSSQCPDSSPTCQNGGFLNKDCTCTCPSHTSGNSCETVSGTYYPTLGCGNADMRQPATITSPNYPSNFPTNIACFWIITAGNNQRVRVTINDMKMLYRHNGRCYWDYISLRYNGDIYTDDTIGCDEELTGQSFESTNNQMIFKFVSGNYGWHRGFTADVQFIDDSNTGGTTVATGGTTAATGGTTVATGGTTVATGGTTVATGGTTVATGGTTAATGGTTVSTGGTTTGTGGTTVTTAATTTAPGGHCGGFRKL